MISTKFHRGLKRPMFLKTSRTIQSCFYLILVALWFGSSAGALSEQASSAVNSPDRTAQPAKSNEAPAQKTEPTTLTSANPDEQQPPPSVPGAKTIILKEGQKVPERKNPDYEDWSRPELTADMRMEVVPLAKSQQDGVIRELISVQWREMDPINLWVVRPAGVSKPPVVIYLYSYPSTNDRYQDPEFCKFLVRDGIAAVGFVSAITGERFHDRARRDWFVNQLQEAMGTSVHDVQMILNYLEKRGDLDMTRVGMWGDGSGASIAIMAAAMDSRIKALDLLDPWGDWPEWTAKSSLIPENQRAEYMTTGFLAALDNLDPLKWLPQLKTPQIRLQYLEQGLTVTPDIVRQKMEAAAPARTKIVHYPSKASFIAEIASKGKSFDWIKGQLQSFIAISGGNANDGRQTSADSKSGVRESDR
jgi:hypothetical protein